jgi:subtilisin family serine protease
VTTGPTPASNGNLTSFSGTSTTSPYVAGIIAMMKAVNPDLTRKQLATVLQNAYTSSPDRFVVPGLISANLATAI